MIDKRRLNKNVRSNRVADFFAGNELMQIDSHGRNQRIDLNPESGCTTE